MAEGGHTEALAPPHEMLPNDTMRNMPGVVDFTPFRKVTPAVQERPVGAVFDSLVNTMLTKAAYKWIIPIPDPPHRDTNVYNNLHAYTTNTALVTLRSTLTLSEARRKLRMPSQPTKPLVRVKKASFLYGRYHALPCPAARSPPDPDPATSYASVTTHAVGLPLPGTTASVAHNGPFFPHMASATQSAQDIDTASIIARSAWPPDDTNLTVVIIADFSPSLEANVAILEVRTPTHLATLGTSSLRGSLPRGTHLLRTPRTFATFPS
jgi:hypothetical protein